MGDEPHESSPQTGDHHESVCFYLYWDFEATGKYKCKVNPLDLATRHTGKAGAFRVLLGIRLHGILVPPEGLEPSRP